ncbi:MAG: helical backbone metal receptor [bacterium]|nr:helical backbone metal receptor [bacterium]
MQKQAQAKRNGTQPAAYLVRTANAMRSNLPYLVVLWLEVAAAYAATSPPASNFPHRIVSFSPALTEMLVAIGAGAQLVGISDFCPLPPGASTCSRLGGTANPNLELLLALHPDLVLLQGEMDTVRRFCHTYHLACVSLLPDSFSTITNSLQLLGQLSGHTHSATVVRTALSARWNAVRQAAAHRTPIPAFVAIWREPDKIASFTIPSPNSFIHEALHAAGGSNICSDVIGNYPTVALEVVMRRRPRVIFDIVPATWQHNPQPYMRAWHSFRHTRAGRNVLIVPITNVHALIPGPHIVTLAEDFSRTLQELHTSQAP